MTDKNTPPRDALKSDDYVAYVLEGAKASYNAIPPELRRMTLECYQAKELRARGVLQ